MHSRPASVQAAISRGDTEALRRMGRKGGRVSQRNRDLKKAVDAAFAERKNEEFLHNAIQANEHLVPVDDTDTNPFFNPE